MADKKTYIETESEASFTISLASLADGAGRQSTIIDNTTDKAPAALISLGIKSGGTAPSNLTAYEVYLIRDTGTIRDDGAGASDAAITILNAPHLGSILVTNDVNTVFPGIFDTSPLGPLGDGWGIAVVNESGQTLNASGHTTKYTLYAPQTEE